MDGGGRRRDTSRCKGGIPTYMTRRQTASSSSGSAFLQAFMATQGEEIASDTRPKMYVWHPAAGRSCSPAAGPQPPTTGVGWVGWGWGLQGLMGAPSVHRFGRSDQRKWQNEKKTTQKLQLLQQQHVVAVKKKKKSLIISLQPHELSVTQTW